VVHEILESLPPELGNHEVDHIAGHQHNVERAAKTNGADVSFDP
jgi:hypothetical protein